VRRTLGGARLPPLHAPRGRFDMACLPLCSPSPPAKPVAQVRPLNPRERDEGLRSCVTFDEPSRQVVLQVRPGAARAVARARVQSTALQLPLLGHRQLAAGRRQLNPTPFPPQAVDKETLLQLRGCTAKGFAFDRRFGAEQSSDDIYDSCVAGLVENLFKVGIVL
jgi:hypothetical protein